MVVMETNSTDPDRKSDSMIESDSTKGIQIVKEIVEELEADSPDIFNGEKLEDIMDDISYVTQDKLTLTYKDNEYHIGTSPSIAASSAEEMVRCGKIEDFIRAISDTRIFLKNNREHPWLKDMSIYYLWLLASTDDFINPVRYFSKRISEVKNNDNLLGFTEVRDVTIRSGLETVHLAALESRSVIDEGPTRLRVAISETDTPQETEYIHDVVLGMESPHEATIYSIQLGRILGTGKQALENAKKENREQALIEYYSEIYDEIGNKYFDMHSLGKVELCNTEDRPILLASWEKFYEWYKSSEVKKSIMTASLIESAIRQLRLEDIQRAFDERAEKLKKFNHGTGNGGARLISLVSSLLFLKERGIRTVKIPLELPLALHLYDDSERENARDENDLKKIKQKQKKELLSYIRGGLIQVIQRFSRAYDVDIKGQENCYIIDLNTWNPEEIQTGDSKTLKDLAEKFENRPKMT